MSPIFGKNDFKDGRAVLWGARRSPQKSHVMSLEVSGQVQLMVFVGTIFVACAVLFCDLYLLGQDSWTHHTILRHVFLSQSFQLLKDILRSRKDGSQRPTWWAGNHAQAAVLSSIGGQALERCNDIAVLYTHIYIYKYIDMYTVAVYSMQDNAIHDQYSIILTKVELCFYV